MASRATYSSAHKVFTHFVPEHQDDIQDCRCQSRDGQQRMTLKSHTSYCQDAGIVSAVGLSSAFA